MTATCEERHSTRRLSDGGRPGREIHYVIRGTDDDQEALDILQSTADLTFGSLIRTDCEVKEDQNHKSVWDGIAYYADPTQANSSPVDTGLTFSFDIGTVTKHVSHSLLQKVWVPAGMAAIDGHGLIGQTADSVTGADIDVPTMEIAFNAYMLADGVTPAYLSAVAGCVGRVNNGGFLGWPAGYLLLKGVAGTLRSTYYEIGFRFGIDIPATITVDTIAGILVPSWHVVTVRWVPDTSGDTLIQRAVAVFVDKVYDDADMTALGIGV